MAFTSPGPGHCFRYLADSLAGDTVQEIPHLFRERPRVLIDSGGPNNCCGKLNQSVNEGFPELESRKRAGRLTTFLTKPPEPRSPRRQTRWCRRCRRGP